MDLAGVETRRARAVGQFDQQPAVVVDPAGPAAPGGPRDLAAEQRVARTPGLQDRGLRATEPRLEPPQQPLERRLDVPRPQPPPRPPPRPAPPRPATPPGGRPPGGNPPR